MTTRDDPPPAARPRPPEDMPVPPHLAFLRRHIWIIAGVLGMITLTVLRPFMRRVPDPPPVMFELPDFSLVDERGQPFTRADMEGKIWVASFIFTSCPSTCPAVTSAMKQLQQRYTDHDLPMRMVSFSVDPETDTPEVLARYAASVGADPDRWRFVTGEPDAIRALVEEGFHLGVGVKRPTDAGPYDIKHSTKLALVGPHGGVRGFYGIDEMGLDELFHRSQHVLREQRRKVR